MNYDCYCPYCKQIVGSVKLSPFLMHECPVNKEVFGLFAVFFRNTELVPNFQEIEVDQ